MDISSLLLSFFSTYGSLAVFFGSLFFGESVILSAAYLSAHNFLSFPLIFVLAFFGTIISDSLWFLFADSMLQTKRIKKHKQKYESITKSISRVLGKGHPFRILLFIKFLYGTRIFTIMYLSISKLSFLRFLLWNAIGTALWLSVIMGLGWLGGKGIGNYFPIMNQFRYIIIAIIVLVLFYRLFTIWIEKKALKK